ncbi:MAG: ABC transporter permease [Chloroflexi bacterium]|nr:ABC transporter permease [Chloroflexota bacterium]MYE41109.1 ABC transporter permease [Chloroflexota bacterium]
MSTIARQAVLLAWKDTRIFFRDRAALAFAFLLPFVFVIGFTLALRDVGPENEALHFTIATQESVGVSVQAVETIVTATDGLAAIRDYDDALAAVDAGEIDGFVAFPPDFTQRFLSGETATLEVVVGEVPPAEEAALRGFAQEIAVRFSEAQATISAVVALGSPQDAAAAMEELFSDDGGPAIGLRVEQVGEIAPFNASNFTLPGYLTMFVFFTAAMGAEALARERQTHTLERLMANGVRRESLIVGKFLAGGIIGVTQVAVMWTVGALAFGIDLGASPVAVVLLSLLMVVASAAFGVMLASFVGNVRTASAAGVLTSLVLAPIGGSWWPLFITPPFMQSLARLTPHGWANGGLNKLMLFGAEFTDVGPEMAALVVFAAVFLAVALWRFRLAPSG